MEEVKRPSLRRWIPLAILFLIVTFVLPPLINLNRYQHRIAENIGRTIGRPVRISSVKLHLLPLPGLAFSDFTVEEDPRFGAEPTLHSSSVVADLRLLSLWRGRMEVSRIHFEDASLNLVREPNGGWNIAPILVQASQIPNAPTGQRFAGPKPRFPYIDAENARINFKQANEKKPLSFNNAELSISLTSDEQWQVHFQAQPVRTDLDISSTDTGLLHIDGTLRRAGLMREMPLNLKVDWAGVPLGQLSRLTLGRDIGWRGGLEVQAQIGGTAQLAQIQSKITVAGFHRAEFSPNRSLDLATTCSAQFRRATRSLEELTCRSPVGEGSLTLTGSIRETPATPDADLALEIDRVPAAAALAVLQEVRSGLAGGVQATGSLAGHFRYASQAGRPPSITGEVEAASLSLDPRGSGKPFLLAPVRLRSDAEAPALLLLPVRVAMGGPAPSTIDGRLTLSGFAFHVSGAAAIVRLQQFNQGFGLLGPSMAALGEQGTANADLNFRGDWLLPVPDPDHPVAPSVAEGSITLHNAEVRTPYLSQPLHIASAQAILSPTQVAWTNASIGFGKLQGQATLDYPVACPGPASCTRHFSLTASSLDLGVLRAALLGGEGGEFFRHLLNRIDRNSSPWPALSGTIQAADLSIDKLAVHDAVAGVDIQGRSMKIRSLNGHAGNGMLHLSGLVDASTSQPKYDFEVEVTNASANALASVFDERWGSGALSLSAQLRLQGLDAEDLADSAAGTVHWNWIKGGFVPFDQWSADASIEDNTVKLTHSLLERGKDAIPVSGTISFDRELDLKIGAPPDSVAVTGTLEHPESKAIREDGEN
jgi:hypothetical protein